jgi:pimeloyl-ACP methyl ester carboxylesterase
MPTRFVEVRPGIRLACDEHGARSAPVVLPILGITDNITDWPESFCEPFVAAGLRVVRFESRDMGWSTQVARDYTIDDVATDVLALMDALGIDAASLVGYSFGGAVAQVIAIGAPQRVRHLVALQSTTYRPALPPRTAAVQQAMAAACIRYATEEGAVTAMRGLRIACNGSLHAMSEAEADASARRSVERGYHPLGTARMIRARQSSAPFFEHLPEVRRPTLVVQGTDDPIFPVGHGADIASRIPGARLVEFAGAGHNHPPSLIGPMLATIRDFVS